MNQITVQVPAFPTRPPLGASLMAELAVFGWRRVSALGRWVRQARVAEARLSHH
jgi:hypothetical protein